MLKTTLIIALIGLGPTAAFAGAGQGVAAAQNDTFRFTYDAEDIRSAEDQEALRASVSRAARNYCRQSEDRSLAARRNESRCEEMIAAEAEEAFADRARLAAAD